MTKPYRVTQETWSREREVKAWGGEQLMPLR